MAGRPWIEEEKRFLRENYLRMTCQEMADVMGTRTGRAIEHCCRAMGLGRPEPKKGDKFGRWELLTDKYLVERYGQQMGMAIARCECGTEREVKVAALVGGTSQSCGCLKNEKASERMKLMNADGLGSHPTHGLSGHPLYRLYHSMLNRCYLSTTKQFDDYGGRGISVCDEWRDSFQAFFDWAVENGWKEGLTLERKEVNGHYTPGNCRFVTMKEQGMNRRNTVYVTTWNETKPLAAWVRDPRCKVDYGTLAVRIKRYGWTPERAISSPPSH